MKYWLISDTHFNHLKLEEWGDRDGDWQEQLWKGLENIPEEDTLIHLGDICIGEDKEVNQKIGKLKCKKVLIKGNHDNKPFSWYLKNGWDFVMDGMHLEFMGHTILLSHRPLHPDMWRFTINIHGHTHGTFHHTEDL